ncbi:MAG: leucyl aminopeptidase family protein [Gammaproteobacteria bacterium]|nr:leucyl aminopeptidase family protein [Gammaproteobacteria bacterium]
MLDCYVGETQGKVIPIHTIITKEFNSWLKKQTAVVKNWVSVTSFSAKPGTVCYLGNQMGDVQAILLGIADAQDVWSLGYLPTILKAGVYSIEKQYDPSVVDLAAIAWGLGHYRFCRYRSDVVSYDAKLLLPGSCDYAHIESSVKATYLVRDLINTPTEDLGPAQLAEISCNVAEEFGAKVKLTIGDELLKKGYPAIHAVGRASVNAPRLIDIRWGKKSDPHITLIGKGVCFDTGGLDIKPAMFMRFMKKDMAGAAHVLGLAQMIMSANLPIQLRVLIPAVENSVSGSAIRPGDVIQMRSGTFVEVTNTDAEGRLILADAITDAVQHEPDLIIDIATLTGAARVALGPEPGAIFTEDDQLANEIFEYSLQEQDPLWRLPIYKPYRNLLESTVADIVNADMESVGGGAIMAALFLKEFVPDKIKWLHLDIMAYNLRYKPSRPIGGEAMGIRAVYRYIVEKYCK